MFPETDLSGWIVRLLRALSAVLITVSLLPFVVLTAPFLLLLSPLVAALLSAAPLRRLEQADPEQGDSSAKGKEDPPTTRFGQELATAGA